MRKLTKEEEKLTKSGIDKLSHEIEILKEMQKIWLAKRDLEKLEVPYAIAKNKYESIVIPYNAKMEEEKINSTLNNIDTEMKAKTHSIVEMTKHIKEGVPEKENKAVS